MKTNPAGHDLLLKQYKELIEDHNTQTITLCNLQTKYIDLKIEYEKLIARVKQLESLLNGNNKHWNLTPVIKPHLHGDEDN